MAETTAAKPALAPTPTESVETRSVFEQFDRIYNSIARRAFEIFKDDGRLGRDLENWFQAESEILNPVRASVTETESAVTVRAEVPGFTTKDLEVRVDSRQLSICGKRETTEELKKEQAVVHERRSDQILRVFDLPADVDVEKSTATLKNGVLELQLPKIPKAEGAKIEVKG